jgi:class 3 adenylate cyclase
MEDKRNIDELVIRRAQKRSELAAIHNEIHESQREATIIIVDLVGSTALKQKAEDADWLGLVYGFIQHIGTIAQKAGGTLVKRMGDGLLLSFTNVQTGEAFLDDLARDPATADYHFKTAADCGSVFYFKFEERLNDDPYGTAVDHCARLLEYARQGVTLCSSSFVEASSNKDRFRCAGPFALKGFAQPHEIFFRFERPQKERGSYLEPLIEALNDKRIQRPGYRYTPRTFSTDDFAKEKRGPRPFLLRELLNVPRLPYSYVAFAKRVEGLEDKEQLQDYVGMMVEWECNFSSYSRIGEDALLVHLGSKEHLRPDVELLLPVFMFDAVRLLKKDQLVRFRGIIVKLNGSWADIDYVDFEIP